MRWLNWSYIGKDVLFPLGGYAIAWWYVMQGNLSRDEKELFFVFVFPIAMCIGRAALASSPQDRPRSGWGRRWARFSHSFVFAAGLIVLMFTEAVAAALQFSSAPLSAWLWILLLYAGYLAIMWIANRQRHRIAAEQP